LKISQKILFRLERLLSKSKKNTEDTIYERYLSEGNLVVGEHTYGRVNIFFDPFSKTQIRIGKFCSIAENVTILNGSNHNVDWVSTYPFRVIFDMKGKHQDGHPATKGDVDIGNDVWIGQGVTIYSGVTIGDGAVLAGNAVVVIDVPPYAIVGGSPAKLIKMRFEEEQVKALLNLKWWNWELDKIKASVDVLCSPNINTFISKNEKS
jgi:acetyltransferase-like isoleucine patch superfamily enzyme